MTFRGLVLGALLTTEVVAFSPEADTAPQESGGDTVICSSTANVGNDKVTYQMQRAASAEAVSAAWVVTGFLR